MQRVRIGLTGLALVFLSVLLAAVFTRASDEQPITPGSIQEAASGAGVASTNAVEVSEPLAELGVAPGSAPEGAEGASGKTVPVEDPLRTRGDR